MITARNKMGRIQAILERKETELAHALRERSTIAVEKCADQMDEIQYASELDLAILNVDRDSKVLRQVRAALRRIHDGTFGTCLDCEGVISPKRLAAVPWAPRCIQCEEANDQDWQGNRGFLSGALGNAALGPSSA